MSTDTSATLARIERTLHELIGLDPTTVGSSLVHRAVHRRIAASGEQSVEAYAKRLDHDGAELQELVEQVVIPETYFFREPEALEAVALRIRSDLPPRMSGPARILSAPCSTGEEPYSIAMVLLAHGVPVGDFVIDALDLSFDALRKAGTAVYGRGSFRGGQEWRPFFDEAPAGLSLHAAVRERVRFAQANLLDPLFRAPRASYDYVFCRNLLIYFDAPTQARVLATLTTLLAPGGVLVVGAADTFAVRRANYVPVPGAERSFLFEQRSPATTLEAPTPPSRPELRTLRTRAKVPRRALSPRASVPARGSTVALASGAVTPVGAERGATDPSRLAREISRLANAGLLDEAITLGEGALSTTADAELLTMMGTTHAALHDDAEAEACYRRALYVDPSHAEALLHLALLLEARHDEDGARRLRMRARRSQDGRAGGAS